MVLVGLLQFLTGAKKLLGYSGYVKNSWVLDMTLWVLIAFAHLHILISFRTANFWLQDFTFTVIEVAILLLLVVFVIIQSWEI